MIKKILDKFSNWLIYIVSQSQIKAESVFKEREDLVRETRYGNPEALAKRLDILGVGSISPIGEREYADEIMVVEAQQGADFKTFKPTIFTGFAKTGDYGSNKKGIRFFLKVVGFQDDRCKETNWGVDFEDMKDLSKLKNTVQGGC